MIFNISAPNLAFMAQIGKDQFHIFGWFVIFSISDPNPAFFVKNKKISVPFFCWFMISNSNDPNPLPSPLRGKANISSILIFDFGNSQSLCPISHFPCKNREIAVFILPLQAPGLLDDVCVITFLKY